jgi:DNA-directed RNA polymerase subunit RPC12/RpoP
MTPTDPDEAGGGQSVNATMDENAGRPAADDGIACPYCESTATHVENARGPSLCRTIYYCESCESPFERFG